MRRIFGLVVPVVLMAGCAVRMGGPKPVSFETVAIRFDAATTATQAAAQLRSLNARLALIVTPRDSVFVREVAQQLSLTPTRPGRINDLTVAFLAMKAEGDTTLSIPVGSGRIQMHDALFKIDKTRVLDLMTVFVSAETPARDAARALLTYIATDVGATAVTALAIHTTTPAAGDSIAEFTRAAWGDSWECTETGRRGERAPALNLRLFFFPAARVRCEQAQLLTAGGTGIHARLLVGR